MKSFAQLSLPLKEAKKMIRLTHTKKNALEGTEVSDKAPGSLYDVFSMWHTVLCFLHVLPHLIFTTTPWGGCY